MPMGYFTERANGSVKKVLHDDVERIELFVAHHILDIVQITTGLTKIDEVLTAPELSEPEVGVEPGATAVAFRDVSFAYGEQTVLDEVSFTAGAGSVTALVGPSGGGKTTIANLVGRLWDVGIALIMLFGISFVINGTLGVPEFLVFLVVATRMYDPPSKMLVSFVELSYYSISAGRVRAILQTRLWKRS